MTSIRHFFLIYTVEGYQTSVSQWLFQETSTAIITKIFFVNMLYYLYFVQIKLL